MGDEVGLLVGSSVGKEVGVLVGVIVGFRDGSLISTFVGDIVGNGVGTGVGNGVFLLLVGFVVGDGVFLLFVGFDDKLSVGSSVSFLIDGSLVGKYDGIADTLGRDETLGLLVLVGLFVGLFVEGSFVGFLLG